MCHEVRDFSMLRQHKRFWLAGVAASVLMTACSDSNPSANLDNASHSEPAQASTELSQADRQFDKTVAELTLEMFQAQPIMASQLNLSETAAGGRYKDRFPVPGIEGHRQMLALTSRARSTFSAFDPASLSADRQEYLAILLANAEAEAMMHETADAIGYVLAGSYHSPYVINQISGLHVDLPQTMTQVHALATVDDAEAYIARLDQFYEQFEGAIEIIDLNADAGVLPPDYAVQGAIDNAALFIAMPAAQNPLYTHFRDALDEIDGADKDGLLERAMATMEGSVYPAYEALISTLRAYLPDATHDAGIWDIPNGPALYRSFVAVNGESSLSPDDIHAQGLAEVARIQSEMEELFSIIGMTEGTAGARLSAITASEDQVFPNTPEGKEDLLAYVRQISVEAQEAMADYFLQVPSIGFEVRPVPDYAQEGAPGGYYSSPAEDGSRPGLYFINLRDTAAQPKFSLPTLSYHEAIPGHHFQLALATEAKETPLLVRGSALTGGWVEGWALYSEKFAAEIGLYNDDPYGDLGRLRDELFRAVRLVVDSGMHAKKWTREEAIDYMVANAGMDPSGVANEIERYSVWPGQALSYKTGMLKIEGLRAKAESALGEDFELAAFHYELLRGGGAPLSVLEQRIDAWIAAGGPTPNLD